MWQTKHCTTVTVTELRYNILLNEVYWVFNINLLILCMNCRLNCDNIRAWWPNDVLSEPKVSEYCKTTVVPFQQIEMTRYKMRFLSPVAVGTSQMDASHMACQDTADRSHRVWNTPGGKRRDITQWGQIILILFWLSKQMHCTTNTQTLVLTSAVKGIYWESTSYPHC